MIIPITASNQDRVLMAVRHCWRDHGRSPTLSELARAAGVRRQHIKRYVTRLDRDGRLAFRPGAPDPIALVDRAAMLTDEELREAMRERGLVPA